MIKFQYILNNFQIPGLFQVLTFHDPVRTLSFICEYGILIIIYSSILPRCMCAWYTYHGQSAFLIIINFTEFISLEQWVDQTIVTLYLSVELLCHKRYSSTTVMPVKNELVHLSNKEWHLIDYHLQDVLLL